MRTDLKMKKFNAVTSFSLPKVATALGVLLFAAAAAHAQDYSAFTGPSGLNAPGVPSPTDSPNPNPASITFPLIRQDLTTLTIKVKGIPATPIVPEAAASGYVNVVQLSSGGSPVYFVDGAFPALSSELATLEDSLVLVGLPITAVAAETAGLNKDIFTVHVEGIVAEPADVLAGGIATALATIASPQLNVAISYPGVIYPTIPKKFQKITNNGQFEVVDGQAAVFSLPRMDATPITVGTLVGTPSIGVAQTVILAGNGISITSVELALKPNEISPVEAILLGGGFTISSSADYFNNDSKRLTFVHATALAMDQNTFEQQAEQLGAALLLTLKK